MEGSLEGRRGLGEEVGEEGIPVYSLVLLNPDHGLYELLDVGSDVGVVGEDNLLFDALFELTQVGTALPWIASIEHLIQNNPQRPNICFLSVLLPLKYLWRHVEWCPHHRLQQLLMVLNRLAEPQVSQLYAVVVQQQVRWLKVTVDHSLRVKVTKGRQYLLYILDVTRK